MEKKMLKAPLLVLLGLVLTSQAQDCPSDCHCNGGQGVMTCKELRQIPDTIPDGIEEIFFTDCYLDGPLSKLPDAYNNLLMLYIMRSQVTSVESNAFENLSKLETLNLLGNNIERIDADILSGLTALTDINLSANKLTNIEANTFKHNPNLKHIKLNSNLGLELAKEAFAPAEGQTSQIEHIALNGCGMTSIPTGALCSMSKVPNLNHLEMSSNDLSNLTDLQFKHVANLETLDLDNCNLRMIGRETLGGMEQLDTLYLSNNKISAIDQQAFDDFYLTLQYLHLEYNDLQVVPPGVFNLQQLKVLNVSHNPWECSCSNAWLQDLPVALNNTSYNISCASPEKYQGQSALKVMKTEIETCSPPGPNPMVAVYVAIPILVILTIVTIIIIVKICKLKKKERRSKNAQYSLVYKPTTETA